MTEQGTRPREAVVLAAGKGARLRPLTHHRPKCLVQVGEVSVVKRLIDQLGAVGVERVVLVTGHHHLKVCQTMAAWRSSVDIDCVYNPGFSITNNAVSLAVAVERLQSQHFLLCDGDVVLRNGRLLESICETQAAAVLGYRRMESPSEEAMKVIVDDDGRVQRLGKSVSPHRADGEALGIQKLGPELWEPLGRCLGELTGVRCKRWYYEDVFGGLVRQGVELRGCELPGDAWAEIDTPCDLVKARRLVSHWDGRANGQ